MVEYRDRLAAAMSLAGKSITDLATALDVSYQAVRKVLQGGTLNAENNARAARYLGVCSDWLATGEGEMRKGEPTLALSDEERDMVLAFRARRRAPPAVSVDDALARFKARVGSPPPADGTVLSKAARGRSGKASRKKGGAA